MVNNGRIAVVHFVGRIADGAEAGTVFDTSDVDVALSEEIYHGHRDYKPLEFRVGAGEVVAGIDEAVETMETGETKTVRVDPERAYGTYDAEHVVEVPRDELETRNDVAAEEGELVQSDTDETGWITDVTDERVVIDFNHELAGQPVEFELRVIDIHDPE
ncbi:FKBP-type peptidyl-prolyl cis-trans isomerase [Halococcus dombrowskii]|uniref:Peptidyl-prolyl cis-trans isomerase n=1 Tax=Halococcus dombrowskii TaxID=179637 RepID=A0AAX3AMG9_HALDO|nr:FKBP-type peptidyl-prolyl cis-trans isomerase [Halococcus dombrowskii]UOO94197.1 FKBP-type peptidyl-prolyl cis-trans isomerase [Halococcus dombrowskii]